MARQLKLGIVMALLSAIAAVGYDVVETMQFFGLIGFPRDAILISGFSLCIATPFMIAMAAFHLAAPPEKQSWTLPAVVLAGMYATLLSIVYFTELTVTIPQTLAGHGAAMRDFAFTPHSFFSAIDAIGYVCMSLSTLLASGALGWRGSSIWLKAIFIAHGLQAPLIVLTQCRPEFLLWASPWLVTGPGSMLLTAVWLARVPAVDRTPG
jgi:hypothetical protein